MRVVVGGRQSGKTHILVEHVKGGVQRADGSWSRVIITHSQREAEWLIREHHLDKRQVLYSDEWGRNRFGGRDTPDDLLVDNIDHWFHATFGRMPSMATSTEPFVTWGIGQAQAVTGAVTSAMAAWEDDLLEDEDGAPYPEEVQALARELRLKMREVDGLLENMQAQVQQVKNKAYQNEQGLLGMLGSVVLGNDVHRAKAAEAAQNSEADAARDAD